MYVYVDVDIVVDANADVAVCLYDRPRVHAHDSDYVSV
jgi:hypothetical protein